MEYLNDIKFLREICSQKVELIYCKINLLDLNEFPTMSLEGFVTDGNISLDGTSALSRSCSLNIIIKDNFDLSNFQWALESKIQIYIGIKNCLKNNINYEFYKNYDIIYFPMGIYYLTTFNLTENNNGISISLSGKDKMQKLSGELGGLFQTTTDLGAIDIINIENNSTSKNLIPIKQIITELIHFYGHEPYEKIFINDIDDYGLNLINYQGNKSLYYFIRFKEYNNEIIPYISNCLFSDSTITRKINENDYINGIEDKDNLLTAFNPTVESASLINFNALKTLIKNEDIENIKKIELFRYDYNDNRIKSATPITETKFEKYLKQLKESNSFMIGKYTKNDIVGYELTSLVYPGDLIANPGDSIASVLDKIKKVLGDFIYFYDINGNFIFKKRNEYLNEDIPLNITFSSKKPNFIFSNEIIQSFQHSYNLSNIKNDFTVWGQQKLSNGVTTDIHARYAIDEKPEQYVKLKITQERAKLLITKYPNLYYSDKTKPETEIINSLIQDPICYYEKSYNTSLNIINKKVDWREIIYQMALDYNKFNQIEEYAEWLVEYNYQYQNGETGYERYYTDLLGFWRDLYRPDKTIVVSQLQELKSDSNIKYAIKLVDGEEDLPDSSYMCTSLGIAFAGGFSAEPNFILSSDNSVNESKQYFIKYYAIQSKIAALDIDPSDNGFDEYKQGELIASQDKVLYANKIYYLTKNEIIDPLDDNKTISLEEYFGDQISDVSINDYYYRIKFIADDINHASPNALGLYEYRSQRSARQHQLRKECNLLTSPTLLEIQLKDAARVFPINNPSWYKNLTWDIESATFPNIQFYKKIFNQNTQKYEYIEVGKLNDIIKNNYKILGYMYYLLSPNNFWDFNINSTTNQYKIYLIREDLDTHIKKSFAKSDLWRIMAYNAEKYSERFNFYTNATWFLVQDNKVTSLGQFYDLTTLYYNAADIINTFNSNENVFSDKYLIFTQDNDGTLISCYYDYDQEMLYEINNSELNNLLKEKYLSLESYPKNKAGISLTDIQHMQDDKMALLLWARANNILLETDNNFQDDGYYKYVFEQPEKIKFWFDFLSPDIFNQLYSIKNIGPREIIKKDTTVNCITKQSIPDMIFINPNRDVANSAVQQLKIQQSYFKQARPNTAFLHLDINTGKQITIASTIKSAIDVIINLLYEHAIAPSTCTISALPQYYLTTDAIFEIVNNPKLINKKYLINKISFSLNHNNLMTITAQEFLDDILNEQIDREIILDTK